MHIMDDSVFTQYVKEKRNIIGVIKRFKRSAVGSNYRWVHKNVERLNLDISHWKKNLNNPRPIRKHSNIDLFVENSDSDRSVIRKRIIKDSLFDYKCIECGISEWRGK